MNDEELRAFEDALDRWYAEMANALHAEAIRIEEAMRPTIDGLANFAEAVSALYPSLSEFSEMWEEAKRTRRDGE
jgi:hypothetical protein